MTENVRPRDATEVRNVLVVDDESRIREVVQYALEREGFRVHGAGDLREGRGRERCTALQPDGEEKIDRHRRIDLVGKAQVAAHEMGDDPQHERQDDRRQDAVAKDVGQFHDAAYRRPRRRIHAENADGLAAPGC